MRTKRTLKNYFTTLFHMGTTILVGLITTPIILRSLGSTRMGAFRAMTDWFGYIGLLELGLGGALIAVLARSVGKSDRARTLGALVVGIRSYLLVALASLLIGLLFSVLIAKLVPIGPGYAVELKTAAALFALQFLFLPLAPVRSLVEARQEGYRFTPMLTLQAVSVAILSAFLAYRGFGIRGQSIAILIGALPLVSFNLWYLTRAFPEVWKEVFRGVRDPELSKSFRMLNRDTLVFDLTGKISLFTDNILVAIFLGTGKVVPLVITIRLIQIVQTALQAVGTASWAALAQIHGSGQQALFRARVVEITELIVVLAFAALVPVTTYNSEFVRYWVGSEHFGGNLLEVVAAFNAGILALISFWAWCFTGTGKIRYLTPGWIAWAAVNLVSSLAMMKLFGIAGPLLGTLISYNAVSLWYVPRQMSRVFGIPARELFGAVLRPFALGVPATAALVGISRIHRAGVWFPVEMAIFSVLFLALYWVLLMKEPNKKKWLEFSKQIRGFRS